MLGQEEGAKVDKFIETMPTLIQTLFGNRKDLGCCYKESKRI